MNITAALFQAVKNFRNPDPTEPNGAAGLAPWVGITSTSLSHKVSPTYQAHCSPEEVVAICKFTGDHTAMQAMAMELGYALLPLAPVEQDVDKEYLASITASAREFGEFLTEAATHYSDKSMTDAVMARITKEFAESMSAQAHVYASLQAKHKADKQRDPSFPALHKVSA